MQVSPNAAILQQKLLLLVAAACAVVGLFYLAYFLAVGLGNVSFVIISVVAVGTLPPVYAKATGRTWTALNFQSAALFERFSSRGHADFANRVLSAMRHEFGGHVETPHGEGGR